MVIESHNFKTLPSLIHRYQNQNLKILLSLLWLSHFTISKFYQPSTRNFFWNGNFSYFYFIIFEERQNVSIIITVVGNNTALVSYVFFGYLRPMSHDVNKKALPRAPPPLPTQISIRFVCYFTTNPLSTFFCSDQIIAEDNAFSNENNFFLLTHCWSVFFFQLCHSETTNQ